MLALTIVEYTKRTKHLAAEPQKFTVGFMYFSATIEAIRLYTIVAVGLRTHFNGNNSSSSQKCD